MTRSFVISLVAGVVVGAVLWLTTDNVVWVAAGLMLPLVWGGYSAASRRRSDDADTDREAGE